MHIVGNGNGKSKNNNGIQNDDDVFSSVNVNKAFKESDKNWDSQIVQMLEKTYPAEGTTSEKTLFLIKALIEFQENHTFGQYDYLFVDLEDIEAERNELFEFIIIKFTQLKDLLSKNVSPISNKLTWKGTPGQFAFIFNLLQEKGYVSGFTNSSEKNAEISLKLFDFENHSPTKKSLGMVFQKLKKDEVPINPDDASKFQKFPNRNDLKH